MNYKWDERFMGQARFTAHWSKDPSTMCGAAITDGKFLVSVGFNGFAAGMDDDPKLYEDRDYKLDNVIHCEENALLSANRTVENLTMYVTSLPCPHCTSCLIQAGIKRLVIPQRDEDPFYYRSDWDVKHARCRAQLQRAGVTLVELEATDFEPHELMGPMHPERVRLGI